MTAIMTEVEVASVEKMLLGVFEALSGPGLAFFLQETVTPFLRNRGQLRFTNEGDDVSGKWAPLKPATVEIRSMNPDWGVGGDHPINVRTTELERWITQSDSTVMPNPLGATLTYPGGTPSTSIVDKMETAQKGRTEPKTVPRPVLGVNETDLLFVLSELSLFIAQAAAA